MSQMSHLHPRLADAAEGQGLASESETGSVGGYPDHGLEKEGIRNRYCKDTSSIPKTFGTSVNTNPCRIIKLLRKNYTSTSIVIYTVPESKRGLNSYLTHDEM